MPPGSVFCREGRAAARSGPRGLRGLDRSPPGPGFFPLPARRRPRYQGGPPASEPHPAHPAELTARRGGSFSIPPGAGAAPALPRPLRLWAGARGCPLAPGRSRASRRMPRAPLPSGEGGGLPLGVCARRPRRPQPARGAPTPARPAAGAASGEHNQHPLAVPCAAPAAAGGPRPAGCRERGPRET